MAERLVLIEVRITHDKPLLADGQTIADLAARGLTEAFAGDDRTLLATARVADGAHGLGGSLYMEGYGRGFVDGKLIAIDAITEHMPPPYRTKPGAGLFDRRLREDPDIFHPVEARYGQLGRVSQTDEELPGVDWSAPPGSEERKASVRTAMSARMEGHR